jgi:DNA-binding NtrC family response regulator
MREDIPLMVEHFITHMSRRKGKEAPTISNEAMQSLMSYKWPGNVRELENLVERMLILKEGEVVSPDDLPERLFDKRQVQRVANAVQVLSRDGIDLNMMLDEIENNMIVQALELSKGVKSKAAGLLGLNRTTLIEKMKKKAIDFNIQN